MNFIRENKDRPFFCYVPFHIVHSPLQAKDSDLAAVDAKVTDETQRLYAAMMRALDRNVAAILAELDQLGLRENTIVVFTSDNGATKSGSNLPLRDGKHSIYEGGTRLPTAIHWPKGGLAGRKKWDGLCGALDMFPTLMAMADLKMPETRPLDGKNVWPALRDNTASPVESYYWTWRNSDAIRTADWRLHRYADRDELYDIRADIGETTNVAEKHPAVVATLKKQMNTWANSLGAALTHQPAPASLDARPAPEGEVLEISATITGDAKPKDSITIPFARFDGRVLATDYLEFDIAVAPGSPPKGLYYSPFKSSETTPTALYFKRGVGFDQFGREQSTGPELKGGAGVWEHRVIGLASFAPGAMPSHAVVLKGMKPGTCKIYLDNLRVRRGDGATETIWASGKDTRAKPIPDTELFKDIKIRAVPADQFRRVDAGK
jgi:hypothetical protein